MNLTQPPFDDVHVRRAMNWVMDKTAMVQAWGGPAIGKVANHIAPDTLFGNQLAEYAPYRTPGDHGSVAKAKAAMKGSKYDTKGDGTCSASACKNVLLLTDTHAVDQKHARRSIQAAAAKIGITFTVRQVAGAYPVAPDAGEEHPDRPVPGLGQGLRRSADVLQPALRRPHDHPARATSTTSLVGITPAQAKGLGLTGNVKGIPSVDAQLDRCAALDGPGAARPATRTSTARS